MKFERHKKENRKQFTALMLACTIVITAVAAGLLSATAIAADTVIYLGSGGSAATTAQLRTGTDTRYQIEDQYGTVWGSDTEIEIFKVSYENGSGDVTVAGQNNEKVIAPGTENTYSFALKNQFGGTLDYKMVVEAYVTGLDGTGKTLPVEARLRGHQSWLVGGEEEYRPVLELHEAEEAAVLKGKQHAMYTLQWRWPFEQDLNGDGNIDDGDALDTWLASREQDVSLTIRITVLSAYHSGNGGSGAADLPQVAPIPPMLNATDLYPLVRRP